MQLKVDVIVALIDAAIRAAKQATKTIPIVMVRILILLHWVCRQPGTARRKHHRLTRLFPGIKRETTGTS